MNSIPAPDDLPVYLSPLPTQIETFALQLSWAIILINIVGSIFGFWYYRFQLLNTSVVMWPVVPDSPLATTLMVLSLLSWRFGQSRNWIHALAFVGNLKYGFWVVAVQIFINDIFITQSLYQWFLLISHLGMGLQAFVIYRYAEFTIPAVGVAVSWFGFNDIVDYLMPLIGDYHHTHFGPRLASAGDHSVRAHDIAAVAAICLTLITLFLMFAVRIRSIKSEIADDDG
ncbi:DUF1405 domain-containing protein [Haloquadratum walsbyi]|uniref:Putative membrane protein n=1 Tax=Haloquadratum walsbyi J07HQW2 TaxID=1238425 RepID=U1PSH9_9EURY|nr:DUF1405 domain-containing protein [Haloquadratum walsbyi]ERG96757.1 MAG: putative membrane protein [Haloquadratum walsbyi J07HQW2]